MPDEPPSMLKSLPPSFLEGDQAKLAKALTAAIDEKISNQYYWWGNYSLNFIDGFSMPVESIDFSATAPWSPWRTIWNPDFDIHAKRALLLRTTEIFQNRYKVSVLPVLFDAFNLDAKVRFRTGWIIGETPIGNSCILGLGINDYAIEVPRHYGEKTIERDNIDWVLRNFALPVQVDIITV